MTMPTLQIFISESCPNCEAARAVAAYVAHRYPGFPVEVIDIERETARVPERVFATPTFMLADRVVCLGTPSLTDVDRWIRDATRHPV